MGRHHTLLAQLLGGRADANVGFDLLCGLLRHLGFEERTRASHHVFRRSGVEKLSNLQRVGDKALVYQALRRSPEWARRAGANPCAAA